MLAKEAWCYGVLLMNGSVGSWPIPVYEQGTNVAVDAVAIDQTR